MSTRNGSTGPLDRILGTREKARANARTVAALTDNPGCTRRRVIDAAGVAAHELAKELGHEATRGRSPFAITTGNRFERRLKEGSDYALLAEVLRPFVDLPEKGIRVVDLGRAPGHRVGIAWLEARAAKTDEVLAKIAGGDEDAPHIVDHPVLVFDLAGTPVYLEPDALAFRAGNQLELVEIKSYAIIDDQADPSKLSATAGQSAVYLLALRASLQRGGFDPDLLRWSVILVAPRNFGRTPVAHRIPLRKKATALQRVLSAVPRTETLLDSLPDEFTLDVDPDKSLSAERRREALHNAVGRLPNLYVPDCLATCDMAYHCRHEAVEDDDPSRLGREARDNLAEVPTLRDALRLAREGPKPGEEHLSDVAEALQSAHQALQRARATVPAACGLDGAPARRRKGKRA